MTGLRAAVAIFLATLAGAAQNGPAPAPAVPRVAGGKLTPSEVRFVAGEILRGETVAHTFTLTNTGTGDLTINEVRACCTCTAAAIKIGGKSLSPAETAACKQLGTLTPGEKAEVTFTLDTLDSGCGGKDGPISKSLNVYSTDASATPLALSIDGNLVTPYKVEPARLDLGPASPKECAKASCILSSDRLGEFKVLKATCPTEGLVKVTFARESTVTAPSVAYDVDAELLSSARAGVYQSAVTLAIDHPRVKAIVVPISVTVRADSQ